MINRAYISYQKSITQKAIHKRSNIKKDIERQYKYNFCDSIFTTLSQSEQIICFLYLGIYSQNFDQADK